MRNPYTAGNRPQTAFCDGSPECWSIPMHRIDFAVAFLGDLRMKTRWQPNELPRALRSPGLRLADDLFRSLVRANGQPLPVRSGFTLVELLVSVSVIAILVAMLLPVLGHGKELSRGVVCLNHLRQLGLASALYADDHSDAFPSFRNWLSNGNGNPASGSLYPYLKVKNVYLCPTDRNELASSKGAKAILAGNAVARLRQYSYGMNCGICHTAKISAFVEPSKTLLYMEAVLGPKDNSGQVGPVRASRSLAFRHLGRGQMVLSDLHVEKARKPWYDQVAKTKRFWLPADSTENRPQDFFFEGLE